MKSVPNPLRVLALTHCLPDEPCTFARIHTPLKALQERGLVEYILEPIWPWRAAAFDRLLRTMASWDLVWVARPRHYLMLPLMQEARRLGLPVLVDLDDWLLEEPDSFDALEWCGTETSRATMKRAILLADAVTASTVTIAERTRSLGVPAEVIENAVDCQQFVRLPRDPDVMTIAYCGTIAHRDDVPLIASALRALLSQSLRNIRVVTMACPIPELEGLAGYTHHPFVPATSYPTALSEQRVDIGLAPLYDTTFNRAHSDIKYLEYSATGAVTVASAVESYRHSVQPSRGLLVDPNTTDAWGATIMQLVENMALRQQLAANAYTWVRAERSLDATATKWHDLFSRYCASTTRRSMKQTQLTPQAVRMRTFEHIVLRQVPYYGSALPPLAFKKASARLRVVRRRFSAVI